MQLILFVHDAYVADISPTFSSVTPTSTVFSKIQSCPIMALSRTPRDTVSWSCEMHKEHKEIRKIAPNSQELADKACPFCGGHKYQLVFRWDMQPQADGLFARCAQCQRPR